MAEKSPPKTPGQIDIQARILVDIGRREGTHDPSVLAAEFFAEQDLIPHLAALDVAELILRGEGL